MPDASHSVVRQLDVVIVGAGLAGLYAIHRLRGLGLKVAAYEAGSGVGGTWFWNRYPGARCDVESLEYSYSFDDALQQEWKWPERYGTQPEILKYINHVADRFDLRRDVQLNTRIKSAVFESAANEWVVKTDTGEEIRARYCVMAAGNLSTPRVPTSRASTTSRASGTTPACGRMRASTSPACGSAWSAPARRACR
jgi:cyclohexanone monooxygenase